jgi:hypothetical protein
MAAPRPPVVVRPAPQSRAAVAAAVATGIAAAVGRPPARPAPGLFDRALPREIERPREPAHDPGPLRPATPRVDDRGAKVGRNEWMFSGSSPGGSDFRRVVVNAALKMASRWHGPEDVRRLEVALGEADPTGAVVVGLTRCAVEVSPARWAFLYPGGVRAMAPAPLR